MSIEEINLQEARDHEALAPINGHKWRLRDYPSSPSSRVRRVATLIAPHSGYSHDYDGDTLLYPGRDEQTTFTRLQLSDGKWLELLVPTRHHRVVAHFRSVKGMPRVTAITCDLTKTGLLQNDESILGADLLASFTYTPRWEPLFHYDDLHLGSLCDALGNHLRRDNEGNAALSALSGWSRVNALKPTRIGYTGELSQAASLAVYEDVFNIDVHLNINDVATVA